MRARTDLERGFTLHRRPRPCAGPYVPALCPLTWPPVITAIVVGEVRDVSRFVDAYHCASYNGTAPTSGHLE